MDPELRHDLVLAIPGVLATLGTMFNAWFSRSLKVHINSRMSELLDVTAGKAAATGHAKGVEEERARQKKP